MPPAYPECALIFDFDDTLVRTEPLKALSYARAAHKLVPAIREEDVLEEFKHLVGRAREEVAAALLERFHLPGNVADFIALRLHVYDEMLADPDLLRAKQVLPTIEVARHARELVGHTACATMSNRAHVLHVLDVLQLREFFDLVIGSEDVKHGKPDPEIYLAVSARLGVDPGKCLVIEDSPSGVRAALAAKMEVIAVPTELTQAAFAKGDLLGSDWIVDGAHQVAARVDQALAATRSAT